MGAARTDTPTLGTVEAMLSLYAEEFIKRAQLNLQENNSTQTGGLEDSLTFTVTRMGTSYTMQLLVNDYYDYVNKGVQGKGKNNMNRISPYKFRFLTPSRTHVEAIRKWLKEGKKKITASDVKRYGKIKQEQKGIEQEDLAYAIAKSMKSKGLRATGFWDDALKVFGDLDQKLSEALGQDIVIDLKNITAGLKIR